MIGSWGDAETLRYLTGGAGPARAALPLCAAQSLCAALASGLTACGGSAGTGPAGGSASDTSPASGTPATVTPATGPPAGTAGSPAGGAPAHIVVVIFENKSYDQIAGSARAPWLNGVMSDAAVFTDARGVTHPSQPNYLALFSGSTQGVTDDHCPVRLGDRPNLARQLIDAGRTFTGYSEDLPAAGYGGCSHAGYAAKHNPWADFSNVPAGANQPYSALPADYSQLPTVAVIVPNLCHDMHDCTVSTGDSWARTHLSGYLSWARANDSLLLITFDENDDAPGNRILTMVAGAGVPTGRTGGAVDHYGVLRTIERCYHLPPLGHAATATPLAGICG